MVRSSRVLIKPKKILRCAWHNRFLLILAALIGYVVLFMMLLTTHLHMTLRRSAAPRCAQCQDVPNVAVRRVNQSHRDDWKNSAACIKRFLGTPPSILNDAQHTASDEEITCSALLFGNMTDNVYDRARVYMSQHKMKPQSDTYFRDLIQDIGCTNLKVMRGYHLKAMEKEEEDFPIAFSIVMHTNIDQVEMLLRSIYRPQNSYCVHIDKKCNADLKDSIRALVSCFDNVFVASRLDYIIYGGYSRLQADINCMRDHLNSTIKWKYLLNVAGQELPAKSNLEMVRILKIYNGANDVEGLFGSKVLRWRTDKIWLESNASTSHGVMIKTGIVNSKPPLGIDIVKGSAYGIFSRNFTEWIMNDENAKTFLEWSKQTFSPDEHYWASLHNTFANPHLKPPGGYAGRPNTKRFLAVFAVWGRTGVMCHGRWLHSICVFGVRDLPLLIRRPEFMFNKFHAQHQPLTQECIGRWIEYKSECGWVAALNEELYRQQPFVLRNA